jgi:acyl dehydratase
MAILCKQLPLLRGRPQGSEGGGKTMQVGDISVWERTFTEEDVRLFTRVSGDQGIQHMKPDEQGRLQVHGLLTATLPTKLGVRYELYRTPDGL